MTQRQRQRRRPTDIMAAIIIAIATIIAAFITGIFLLQANRQSSLPPTSTITTPTVTSQPTSSTTFAFDFETSTQNWGTSEGAFKLAKVDLTNNPVHSGTYAL